MTDITKQIKYCIDKHNDDFIESLNSIVNNYLNTHPNIDPMSFKEGFDVGMQIWNQTIHSNKSK